MYNLGVTMAYVFSKTGNVMGMMTVVMALTRETAQVLRAVIMESSR